MPTADHYFGRTVLIEYDELTDFSKFPLSDRMTILLVTSGSGQILLNNNSLLLKSPCVLLLSEDDTLSLIKEDKLMVTAFSFSPCFVNSSLPFSALKNTKFTQIEDLHDIILLNHFLIREDHFMGIVSLHADSFLRIQEWLSIIGTETVVQSDGKWTCRIRRYLLQILYLLDDMISAKSPLDEDNLKSIVDICIAYIQTNYQQNITQKTLCDLVHTNRTTLNIRFKEQVSMTSIEYLLYYRIKIAKEALTHTRLTIAEISDAIGFSYESYFIRQFRKKVGVTPAAFRREQHS